MKALGCSVRSLNNKLICSTAVISVHLTLPEFYLFCGHKELKEIEFCKSWKIASNCILTYFLFWRADTVGIVGWLNFIDVRLLVMKRNITVLFHCNFLFYENIFVSFISDVILFPHQMSRKQALIMHVFSVLERREPAQWLTNIACRTLYLYKHSIYLFQATYSFFCLRFIYSVIFYVFSLYKEGIVLNEGNASF